jgi:hypothetical protein
MTAPMTKTNKLLRLLEKNQYVSTKSAVKRTGLGNLSATVHRLRSEGFDIPIIERANKSGQVERYLHLVS